MFYIFFLILLTWDLSGDLHFCGCRVGNFIHSGITRKAVTILIKDLWTAAQTGQLSTN